MKTFYFRFVLYLNVLFNVKHPVTQTHNNVLFYVSHCVTQTHNLYLNVLFYVTHHVTQTHKKTPSCLDTFTYLPFSHSDTKQLFVFPFIPVTAHNQEKVHLFDMKKYRYDHLKPKGTKPWMNVTMTIMTIIQVGRECDIVAC